MKQFCLRLFLISLAFSLLLASLAAVWGSRWVDQPLKLNAPRVDLQIASGSNARAISVQVQKAGVEVDSWLLYAWFRLSGQALHLQAGFYELETGLTPKRLLQKLVRGEQAFRSITLIEGWNVRQVRAALEKAPDLKADSKQFSDQELMVFLDRPDLSAEGRFFPDTYQYTKGESDITVLKRALSQMDNYLQAAWSARAVDLPLKNPEEVLILASIIEKETGKSSDRALISGVFNNRLKKGMLLQTDPTVIYGLGESFDGNLTRENLRSDTPWNTYTRAGLPPTPIAMPGKAALLAAVQPAQTQALYFVARGDGSSYFSETLEEHNRAVNQYQRGRNP